MQEPTKEHQPGALMNDRNLLFGAVAMQAGLIDADQFAEACSIWSGRRTSSLPETRCEHGWLVPQDRIHVDYLVKRNLAKFGGDVRASIAGFPGNVRSVLATIGDNSSQRLTSGLSETIATETGGGAADNYREVRAAVHVEHLARDVPMARSVRRRVEMNAMTSI